MTKELDFGISARLREGQTSLFKQNERCIDEIGMPVAVAATGARRQDLRDALSDREGRRWPVEWSWGIAIVSPEDFRAEVAKALVKPLGYGIAPLVPMTAEQELARLKYRVASRFGQAGVELVEGNER